MRESTTDVPSRFERFRSRLSYANVMSTLAVVIALAGGSVAYAAATIGSRGRDR